MTIWSAVFFCSVCIFHHRSNAKICIMVVAILDSTLATKTNINGGRQPIKENSHNQLAFWKSENRNRTLLFLDATLNLKKKLCENKIEDSKNLISFVIYWSHLVSQNKIVKWSLCHRQQMPRDDKSQVSLLLHFPTILNYWWIQVYTLISQGINTIQSSLL